MPGHQELLIQKLQAYLKLNCPPKPPLPAEDAKMEEKKAYQRQLEDFEYVQKMLATISDTHNRSLREGLCFGFALCHAAFDIEGEGLENKLDWWEDGLQAIAAWQEDAAALDKPLVLQGQDSKLNPPLASLFERVLSYVLHNFAATEPNFAHQKFLPENMNQPNYLNPKAHKTSLQTKEKIYLSANKSFFEILDKNNKIHTVQAFKRVAGHFEAQDLKELLKKEDLENNICIIENETHAIRLGFTQGQWRVYDPEYPLEAKLHKSFYNQEEVLTEVLARMGNNLALSAASLFDKEKHFFKAYDTWIREQRFDLLDKKGLHMMARLCPDNLNALILNLDENTREGKEQLAQLIKNCGLRDKQENPAFKYMVANLSSAALTKLLHYIFTAEAPLGNELKQALDFILFKEDHTRGRSLHYLCTHAPQVLHQLIKLIQQDKTEEGESLQYRLVQLLAMPNQEGWTGLSFMAHFSQEALTTLLQGLFQDEREEAEEAKKNLALALVMPDPNGNSGQEGLKLHAPLVFQALKNYLETAKGDSLRAQLENFNPLVDLVKSIKRLACPNTSSEALKDSLARLKTQAELSYTRIAVFLTRKEVYGELKDAYAQFNLALQKETVKRTPIRIIVNAPKKEREEEKKQEPQVERKRQVIILKPRVEKKEEEVRKVEPAFIIKRGG